MWLFNRTLFGSLLCVKGHIIREFIIDLFITLSEVSIEKMIFITKLSSCYSSNRGCGYLIVFCAGLRQTKTLKAETVSLCSESRRQVAPSL